MAKWMHIKTHYTLHMNTISMLLPIIAYKHKKLKWQRCMQIFTVIYFLLPFERQSKTFLWIEWGFKVKFYLAQWVIVILDLFLVCHVSNSAVMTLHNILYVSRHPYSLSSFLMRSMTWLYLISTSRPLILCTLVNIHRFIPWAMTQKEVQNLSSIWLPLYLNLMNNKP